MEEVSPSYTACIEALLFVSNRPLDVRELAALCQCSRGDVEQALSELVQRYADPQRGILLIRSGSKSQFSTSPSVQEAVRTFVRQETVGDLTRPQLETLTIIAYRGPLAKEDIEDIRGVNCSVVLRNLLMRGLVEEKTRGYQKVYEVSVAFLRHLGLASVADLPDYDRLQTDEPAENSEHNSQPMPQQGGAKEEEGEAEGGAGKEEEEV